MERIKKINTNGALLLILIVLLAAVLRFWQLGAIPASLNWDEVAWGYNAYSLSTDGKDEFGQFLPYKYIESYGDYKPPVYAYLSVIPVTLFGLNEFSTRFASALFGTLSVPITFFLVKRIFYKTDHAELIALFSALFLAISPWHINLSRAAFEANVAVFFVITGVWSFLAAAQERKWLFLVSALCFALSFYTFNAPRIVSPILLLSLFIGFCIMKRSFLLSKELIIAGVLGVVMLLPLLGFLLSPQAKLRFNEVNIFSDVRIVEQINQEVSNDNSAVWSKVIHNRRFIYSLTYLKHYFDNVTPSFLFLTGDENHKFSTKDVGELYFYDSILLLVGIFFLFKRKDGVWWVLPLWFLIGLIPASTARETPHALRTEIVLPTIQIVCAYGLTMLLLWTKVVFGKRGIGIRICFGLLIVISVLYYLHGYYVHYGRESAGEWNYGYKESIAYVASVEKNYDEVRVTNQLGRPYAYYAFYLKTDPAFFRKSALVERDVFGFVTVNGFGKYRFGDEIISSPADGKKRILYITVPERVPQQAKILKTFMYPDGYHRLTAYTL